MQSLQPTNETSQPNRFFAEREFWLVGLLVAVVFLSRLTLLTPRGEETRRAQVAAEIVWSGDWIVPRQQGQIYTSRPPAGSWPIAVVAMLRGQLDLFAVRFPTAMAVVLTSMLIYAYARNFFSRIGAVTAALAYPTMGQVLQIGRLAETEGVFTLWISGALIIWHWGYFKKWSPTLTWSLGYATAVMAALTKGPQGIVYFVAPTGLFLLIKRDWRFLFGKGQWVGLGVLIFGLGAWQIPYFLRTDSQSVIRIWTKLASERFYDPGWMETVQHFVRFPLEVLVCMMPWSLMLVAFFDKRILRSNSHHRSVLLFALVSLAITFPSVWMAVGARGRYYMPMYPMAALRIGFVVERCFLSVSSSKQRTHWNRFAWGMAATVIGVGAGLCVISGSSIPGTEEFRQPLSLAIVVLLASIVAAACLMISRQNVRFAVPALFSLAMFVGLLFGGPVINAKHRKSLDASTEFQAAKNSLPNDAKPVGIGIVHHKLRFLLGEPIDYVDLNDQNAVFDYFWINNEDLISQGLDFEWEEVGRVSMERNKGGNSKNTVILGRRSTQPMVAKPASESVRIGTSTEPATRIE